MRVFLFFFFLLFLFTSCGNKADIGKVTDVKPEAIYYDYKIWGEEGKDDVTVMLQFRFGSKDGPALILDEPSKVTLDGVKLQGDSVSITGAFYELVKPLNEFRGEHTIIFTDSRKGEHKEEFNFLPFSLITELPEEIENRPFTIQLKDFPQQPTGIRLVMIDTSYQTMDVNEEIVIKEGQIPITANHLSALSAGPVTLEIYREEETPLKNASKKGGRLLMTYGLRRQFTLME